MEDLNKPTNLGSECKSGGKQIKFSKNKFLKMSDHNKFIEFY